MIPGYYKCVYLSFLLSFGLGASQHIRLVEQPSTLLLPVNKNGTFSCKAQCDHHCLAFWILNNSQTLWDNTPRMHYSEQFLGNTSALTLTVNASTALNNTRIACRYEATGDRPGIVQSNTPAVLLVLSEPPITFNPTLVRNTTHVTLLWSPPFIWPGHRINYFNVSYTMINLGSIRNAYHRINGSQGRKIMSFTVDVVKPSQSELSCIYITFNISAFENLSESLQTVNVSDWMWTSPLTTVFTPKAINTSVIFKSDGTPTSLEVYIQLQRFNCCYRELNLTLLIKNGEGDLETETNVSQHLGSDVIVNEVIAFDFKKHEIYSLQLMVEVYSHTIMTNEYYFHTSPRNTSKNCDTRAKITEVTGTLPYKVLMNILAGLTAVMLSIFVVLVVHLCICSKRGITNTTFSESRVHACNVMVDNPIYDGDGPVYDSVQHHLSHPRHAASQYDNINCTDATHTFQDNSNPSGNPYVDQPIHFYKNMVVQTDNTTNDSLGTSTNALNYSTCDSMLSTQKMALKKNGQERNKLHLTLSLPGNDSFPMKEILNAFPKSYEIQEPVVDENYMVMNPAGAVCLTPNFRSLDD